MGVCFIHVLGNWVCMLAPISYSLYLRSNSGRYSSFRPCFLQALRLIEKQKGFHKSHAAVCLHKTAHQKSLWELFSLVEERVKHAGVWGYIPVDHCSQNAPLSSTWGSQRKEGFNHRKAFSVKYCKSLRAHGREKEIGFILFSSIQVP